MIGQLEPWYNMTDVGIETLGWVDWFNNRRLLEPIANIPAAEFEALYDRSQRVAAEAAGLTQSTLRRTRGDSVRMAPALAGCSPAWFNGVEGETPRSGGLT